MDYVGSRCSNEIRINVCLTLHLREMGSPCPSFILPSIYQCHSVNYCFIYLVTYCQNTNLPLCPCSDRETDCLLDYCYLALVIEIGLKNCQQYTVGFCSTTNSTSSVSHIMPVRLDHALREQDITPPSTADPCLCPHLEKDTRPDH